MKKWFLPVFVWIYLPTFAQEMIRVNFNDSCIIRSVKLSRKNFMKMKRLCPPELSKVNSCVLSLTSKGIFKDFALRSGGWNPKAFRNITVGNKLLFTNIKGTDANGKELKAEDIVVIIN